MKSRFIQLSFVILIICFGCNKQQEPQQTAAPQPVKPILTANSAVQRPASSSMKILSVQRNDLDFSNKKDPFKPYVNVKNIQSKDRSQQEEKKAGLPIHSYDVSQFRLIGIVSDPKGNKAMVIDPSGKGYVLRIGMTIGQNEGKIIKIDSSGIDVVEQSKDAFNKVRKETVRIPLLKKP